MMDKPMTAAVEDFVRAGYDLTAEAILLCESDGTPEEVEEEIARMSEVLRTPAPRPSPSAKARKSACASGAGARTPSPPAAASAPTTCAWTPPFPRKRLADILLAIQEMEKKYQLRCANVFHAGDGNLHPLILFDANDPDELHRCELFGADIWKPAWPWAAR
jgi:glycolate oxidase